MFLALILFVGIFCASPTRPLSEGLRPSSPHAATQSPAAPAAQDQGTAAPAEEPAPAAAPATKAQGQPSSAQTPPAAKHTRRKKKLIRSDCGTLPGAGQSAPGATAGSTPPDAAAAGRASTPANATANCPPPKKVVPLGGASDPNIQLAGGPGGQQASRQRATANQMMGATEENLKKIAGRQLSPSQQDVVSQIHQFMDQSKAAVTAGDLDRALTLASKAQMLSEELAKPAEK